MAPLNGNGEEEMPLGLSVMGEELIITGKTNDQLRRMVQAGNAYRLCRGVVLFRKPTPSEAYDIVRALWPQARLSGRSVLEVLESKPLTFPLVWAAETRMPESPLWRTHRKKRIPHTVVEGRSIAHPLIAAAGAETWEGLRIIETRYGGRAGKEKLDKELEYINRLAPKSKKLLNRAAIGTDSWAEREVVRRLRDAGLAVECNHLIGVYRWDIVIPELKLAIEIDGFEFHGNLLTFIKDHWKRNDAALRGWLVLGYTGSCVKHNLDDVVGQILQARKPDFQRRWHKFLYTWHRLVIEENLRNAPLEDGH